MMQSDDRTRAWLPVRAIALMLTVPVWVGCNFDVTNPGPVQDKQLDDPAAQQALVNGAGRALSRAVNWIALTGGVAALEIQGSGNITLFGVTLKQRDGDLAPEQAETDEHWQLAQTARWVAEESVRRMESALGDEFSSDSLAAQGLLYVGYSNRLLAENMCVAVIDGGPAEPRTVYLDRALAAFTSAIEIAESTGRSDLLLAARAGRASVNAWLNDWEGVELDAAGIPPEFVYRLINADLELDQYNRIYWAGANSPFRAVTVWGTYFDSYFRDTNDPRTPWTTLPEFPTGDGSTIPFYRQLKYTSTSSPIRLSTGREMQLLLAEAKLREDDWQAATAVMNELRADLALPSQSTANAEESWNMLRRERAAELWLEARSLGDIARWERDNVPGSHFQDVSGRDRCFPIGQSEIDTNPNISGELG
jgi:starch-binding outer membrane protein, SusD/RagB family